MESSPLPLPLPLLPLFLLPCVSSIGLHSLCGWRPALETNQHTRCAPCCVVKSLLGGKGLDVAGVGYGAVLPPPPPPPPLDHHRVPLWSAVKGVSGFLRWQGTAGSTLVWSFSHILDWPSLGTGSGTRTLRFTGSLPAPCDPPCSYLR